ncbi:MAG TPA: amino acid permease [Thermoleophilia bacterium]|nr:amino acid permease [Thermoleophilia bacterium]HQG03607.1 amino acid permease [Thermoleophilia bacterium]HQJ97238.1 amino acid permease [Thermoleophilia bacterium]
MARRKHREGEGLHKVLGVPALFSTAYGNVGSSIYYALGVVAASALGATPLVFVLTGLLFVTTAWTYAEATAAMPEAGGASSFARRAFNEFVSFGIGWGQMLVYTATIAISALFVPHYLSVFIPLLKEWPYNAIGGIAVAVVLIVVNVIGIKEAANLNIALAVLDLATQVLIVVIAVVLLLEPRVLIEQIEWGVAPTWKEFLYGLAMGTVAYTGIETVSNMAEEATSPGRDVPRAINYVILAILVVYIGMPLAGLSVMKVGANTVPVDPVSGLTVPVEVLPGEPEGTWVLADDPSMTVYVPVEEVGDKHVIPAQEPTGQVEAVDGELVTRLYGSQLGSNYMEDPVLGIVRFMPDSVGWLRTILAPWVGVLAATILVIGANAGLIGVSRLTYSLGQHRQLPPVLGHVHPKRLTPYVSIIVFGLAACALMVPGSTKLLTNLYIFGSMISFTAAHLSVVVLRVKEPGLERPWRPPLNVRWGTTSLPLTAIVGALGTFSVWIVIVVFQGASRYIAFGWLAVGLVMYVAYRRAKGYSLTQTVARVVIPEAMRADIDYDQILVPIVGSRITDEMVVLACQLANEKGSSIDALYVIEVPMNLPLDAPLVEERKRAEEVLQRAMTLANEFKVKMNPIIITARSAGRAIVQQAIERRSEVIILGVMKKRRFTERAFGSTTDYVIEHAPCEVIVNIVPPTGVYESEARAPRRVGGPRGGWLPPDGGEEPGEEPSGTGTAPARDGVSGRVEGSPPDEAEGGRAQ